MQYLQNRALIRKINRKGKTSVRDQVQYRLRSRTSASLRHFTTVTFGGAALRVYDKLCAKKNGAVVQRRRDRSPASSADSIQGLESPISWAGSMMGQFVVVGRENFKRSSSGTVGRESHATCSFLQTWRI